MTVAPTAPAVPAATGRPRAPEPADGAGAALLRTLVDLTADLPGADPGRVAAAVLRGRSTDAGPAELRSLAIEAAAGLISEDPVYSRLAARLLTAAIAEEAAGQGAVSFSASVATGHREGLIADRTAAFVTAHAARLDALVERALADRADDRFGYFGLRTLYSRYLLRHPITRQVVETPQHFMLRVAAGLAEDDGRGALDEVASLYRLMSALEYLPSSPTLFNSGTRHPQMSSCYLLDSPLDELDSIYDRYHQVARLSKHAGGIGLPFSRVRARGSLIRGTNGHSNGIVPFLKTLDASVAAVNQGGRRKGAAAVYLETWHSDIEEFLELRDNTGEDARRTHNLNLAHWIPDEFMRRVDADADWSLFSPSDVPALVDLWGAEFDAAYRRAEAAGLARRTIPARELYGRMMRTLAQTGNGWMTFKDAANRTANQTARPGRTVHSSNLCTEILEVTDDSETAVCNLGSVNLAAFVTGDGPEEHGLGAAGRHRPHRRDLPGPRGRHQLLPDRAGRPLQLPLAAGGSGRHGPAGRLLPAAAALRLPRPPARCPRRSPSGSCSPPTRRPATSPSATARCRPGARPVPPTASCTPTTSPRTAHWPERWDGAARPDRRHRPAQLAAARHRADRHHRVHRGRVRVHRAAGVQPLQARDAVAASSSRSTPTWWPT